MLVYELEGSISMIIKPCEYCENENRCEIGAEKCREVQFFCFCTKKHLFNKKEHESYNNRLKQNLSELKLLILHTHMPYKAAMEISGIIDNIVRDSESLSIHTDEFRKELQKDAMKCIKKYIKEHPNK